MNIAGKFDAVIFDMDGVLCDSEPFICEAACLMFNRQYNLQVKQEDFIPFVGTGENRYLGGVAKKYGISLKLPEDKTLTYDIYLKIIQNRLKPLPGAVEFVKACKKRELKIGLASSADNRKIIGNLKEINLPISVFDVLLSGNDCRHTKPDPDIFIIGAAKIGVLPSMCLAVEDAPSGIRAAKTAGMSALGVTSSFSKSELTAAGADRVVPGLNQLYQYRINI
jgi:beta-phosphoglucomutase